LQNLLSKTRHIVVGIIDFFHKPFARIIPTQTFRYLACGGSNTVLNILIYDLAYNVLFSKQDFHVFGNINIAVSVAAWLIAFSISFPAGFIMSRHIVFPESNLHGRIQLFRYALTTITFIIVTYLLIKFFDTYVPFIHPTISYTFICLFTAVLSYISQRKFTFKSTATPEALTD
jgi:putative flippase GtrA